MMTKLSTELKQDNLAWTLRLTGSVTSGTTHLMWSYDSSDTLLKAMAQTQANRLFIDLDSVEAIDSHGLRHLLNAQKEFSKENIGIVLQNPNSHLKRLFRIMQFDRVFVVEPSE